MPPGICSNHNFSVSRASCAEQEPLKWATLRLYKLAFHELLTIYYQGSQLSRIEREMCTRIYTKLTLTRTIVLMYCAWCDKNVFALQEKNAGKAAFL